MNLQFSILSCIVQRGPTPVVFYDTRSHYQKTLHNAMVALTSSKVQCCGSILILTGQVQICKCCLKIKNRYSVIIDGILVSHQLYYIL